MCIYSWSIKLILILKVEKTVSGYQFFPPLISR